MKVLIVAFLGLAIASGCAALSAKDLRLSNDARRAIQDEEYAKAEVLLNEALKINPESAYAWVNLGVVNQKRGDVVKARECYTKAIEFGSSEKATNREASGNSVVSVAKQNLATLQ